MQQLLMAHPPLSTCWSAGLVLESLPPGRCQESCYHQLCASHPVLPQARRPCGVAGCCWNRLPAFLGALQGACLWPPHGGSQIRLPQRQLSLGSRAAAAPWAGAQPGPLAASGPVGAGCRACAAGRRACRLPAGADGAPLCPGPEKLYWRHQLADLGGGSSGAGLPVGLQAPAGRVQRHRRCAACCRSCWIGFAWPGRCCALPLLLLLWLCMARPLLLLLLWLCMAGPLLRAAAAAALAAHGPAAAACCSFSCCCHVLDVATALVLLNITAALASRKACLWPAGWPTVSPPKLLLPCRGVCRGWQPSEEAPWTLAAGGSRQRRRRIRAGTPDAALRLGAHPGPVCCAAAAARKASERQRPQRW